MIDYGCDRVRLIALWKRSPESLCVSSKNMGKMVAVETMSSELMVQYGFNLDGVSTTSAIHFVKIKDAKVKHRVMLRIKKSITENVNPLTGGPLTTYGITESLMREIIRTESGSITGGKIRRRFLATPEEIQMIRAILKPVILRATGEESDKVQALYKKITGEPFG